MNIMKITIDFGSELPNHPERLVNKIQRLRDRIEAEVQTELPDARIIAMTSDTDPDAILAAFHGMTLPEGAR